MRELGIKVVNIIRELTMSALKELVKLMKQAK